MFDCIIVMAGKGTRTNLLINKVLYEINGKKVYQYSLEKFLKLKECHKIIAVCNSDDYEYFKSAINHKKVQLVVGGLRRQDSVLAGLKLATTDIVLIHDAARINTSIDDILKVYQAISEDVICSCLGSKVSDTIKIEEQGIKTLDREKLYAISTPEAVKRIKLIEALEKLDKTNFLDDSEAMEKYYGVSPKIVLASNNNFKLTTMEDINYAKYLLEEKHD